MTKLKKIKIAHIQLLPMLSGVQKVTFDECVRFRDSVECHLICKEEGSLTEKLLKYGVKVSFIESLKREISLWDDFRALISLWKLYRKEKFDVVHSHSSKTGVLSRIAAKLAGVPVVVHTVHGFSFPAANSILSKALYYIMEFIGGLFSDIVICLHEEDKNIAHKKLFIPNKKIKVIPNGVDLNVYAPRKIYSDRPTKATIGMVGRLWPQKDPETLVRAAIQLSKVRDDFQVIILGSGELEDKIKGIIKQFNAEEIIILRGWCENVPEMLSSFDIFVLPSRWEGMPLSILEAQAASLPCVVSNIPGNSHLVTDYYDGLVFEVSNSDHLAEKLCVLLDDRDLSLKLGRNARHKVENEYDINARIKCIMGLYLNALGCKAIESDYFKCK